jgi:hypothetical protein
MNKHFTKFFGLCILTGLIFKSCDAQTVQVTRVWTVPTYAVSYSLKYSTDSLKVVNFLNTCDSLPRTNYFPLIANDTLRVVVTVPQATTLFYAVKSYNGCGSSPISNIYREFSPCILPSLISNLR